MRARANGREWRKRKSGKKQIIKRIVQEEEGESLYKDKNLFIYFLIYTKGKKKKGYIFREKIGRKRKKKLKTCLVKQQVEFV